MSDTKTPETDAIWDACATPFEALSKMRDFARTLESENTRLREQVASLERDRLRALNIAGEHLDRMTSLREQVEALRSGLESVIGDASYYPQLHIVPHQMKRLRALAAIAQQKEGV
jgi:hypothetical protein